jgi:hypothetical protein
MAIAAKFNSVQLFMVVLPAKYVMCQGIQRGSNVAVDRKLTIHADLLSNGLRVACWRRIWQAPLPFFTTSL